SLRNSSIANGRGPSRLKMAALIGVVSWLTRTSLIAASFTATLDRETVTVGESATLSLKFEGGQPKAIPGVPSIPNLQVSDTGNSRNISIVNGEMTSSISQNFALVPTQPGEFTIPALRAEINGQVLTTQPLKLKALKAGVTATNQAAPQLAFLKL